MMRSDNSKYRRTGPKRFTRRSLPSPAATRLAELHRSRELSKSPRGASGPAPRLGEARPVARRPAGVNYSRRCSAGGARHKNNLLRCTWGSRISLRVLIWGFGAGRLVGDRRGVATALEQADAGIKRDVEGTSFR